MVNPLVVIISVVLVHLVAWSVPSVGALGLQRSADVANATGDFSRYQIVSTPLQIETKIRITVRVEGGDEKEKAMLESAERILSSPTGGYTEVVELDTRPKPLLGFQDPLYDGMEEAMRKRNPEYYENPWYITIIPPPHMMGCYDISLVHMEPGGKLLFQDILESTEVLRCKCVETEMQPVTKDMDMVEVCDKMSCCYI